jgi:3'-phosphoadenosine 5'-phosphosulfate sulfotransferase (PAPS reductase)/FAD synthetase
MKKEVMKDEVGKLQIAAEAWSPERVLGWAFDTFGDRVAISSAFGAEGMVLIDVASRVRPTFRLFTLDTEFLFPETYNLMDEVEQKYGITIERVYPLSSPEEQEHGPALWLRNPDLCCNLRKVEPLRRATSVDHEHSARPDRGSRRRRQNRMGPQIWSGEDQSYRGLEFEAGVALHPRARRTL